MVVRAIDSNGQLISGTVGLVLTADCVYASKLNDSVSHRVALAASFLREMPDLLQRMLGEEMVLMGLVAAQEVSEREERRGEFN